MLKKLEKARSMVIVPRGEVRLVFPFSDASAAPLHGMEEC